MVTSTREMKEEKMKFEVTSYGILKALGESNASLNAHAIAVLANIDTTSENLQKIKDQLYDFAELGFVEVNTARNRNQPWFKVVV
jgi:hypothetical protein